MIRMEDRKETSEGNKVLQVFSQNHRTGHVSMLKTPSGRLHCFYVHI